MAEQEKTAAVREYLQAEFSGFSIEDQHDPKRQMHVFKVGSQDRLHNVLIADDFLNKHDTWEIPDLLRKFLLAEHMREMNSTPLIVTNNGLELEYE